MKTNKWLAVSTMIIAVGVVALFTFVYNITISAALSDSAKTDRSILAEKNTEIIKLLTDCESKELWQGIIDSYSDVVIHIDGKRGDVVTKTTGRDWSKLDVKVTTPFEYEGVKYRIRSSVAFERDYLTDAVYVVRLFICETVIVMFALALFCGVIYFIMLKPYRQIYKSIESYESFANPGDLKRSTGKSYTARVYNRICDLKENVAKEQNNQHRIIASISHDIKTPLTSIMGYAEQLKKDNISPERRARYLNIVYEKSVEIRNLVNDFDEYLSYSLDNSVYIKPYSTEEFCQAMNETYFDELERENVSLVIKNNAPGHYVGLDEQKIRRVIGNIITNSLKHYKGEERIFETQVNRDGRNIVFVFSDNGEGVPQDKLEVIFEPLYTSDEGRKVAGLGLAICREIVEKHGGSITADKSHSGGLSIIISLPETKHRRSSQ